MNGSTRLEFHVVPGATRPGLVGRQGAAWKVKVNAPAEAGRANEAVVNLLPKTLALPRRDISIAGGQGSHEKILAFEGISADELESRLVCAISGRAVSG